MKHLIFQQLILCIFYGIIPFILFSWYVSKNQKEFDKASNDLYIATEDLKNAIANNFMKSKTFHEFVPPLVPIFIIKKELRIIDSFVDKSSNKLMFNVEIKDKGIEIIKNLYSKEFYERFILGEWQQDNH